VAAQVLEEDRRAIRCDTASAGSPNAGLEFGIERPAGFD